MALKNASDGGVFVETDANGSPISIVTQGGKGGLILPLSESTETFDMSTTVIDWSSDFGTLSATNGTFALDQSVMINGAPAVKAVSNNTSPFTGTYTLTNPISLANFINMVAAIRITSNETGSGIGTSALKFVMTTSTGKTITMTVHTIDIAPGLFYSFEWDRSQDATNGNFFTYTGGATIATFDTESIVSVAFTFTFTGSSASNYPIWIGPIKTNCTNNTNTGVVSWTFDGPYTSHLRIASILNRYGVMACFAIRNQLINDPSGLTESQLDSIYSAGHDIIHHTYASNKTNGYVNATDWPTSKSITDDHLNQWAFFRSKSWLRGIGFSVRGFADMFPASVSQARQILEKDALVAAGVKLMRGSQSTVGRKIPMGYGSVSTPEIIKYQFSTSDTTTLSNLTSLMDRAAVTKEHLVILCHGIDGGAGNQGLSGDIFEAAIAYQNSIPGIVNMKLTDAYYRFYK